MGLEIMIVETHINCTCHKKEDYSYDHKIWYIQFHPHEPINWKIINLAGVDDTMTILGSDELRLVFGKFSFSIFDLEKVRERMVQAVMKVGVNEVQKKNCIQVSNTEKPIFFYLNLAKRPEKYLGDVEAWGTVAKASLTDALNEFGRLWQLTSSGSPSSAPVSNGIIPVGSERRENGETESESESESEEDTSEEDEEDESSEDSEFYEVDDSTGGVKGEIPAFLFNDSWGGNLRDPEPLYKFKVSKLIQIEHGAIQIEVANGLERLKTYVRDKLNGKRRVPNPFLWHFQYENQRKKLCDDVMLDPVCFKPFVTSARVARIAVFPPAEEIAPPPQALSNFQVYFCQDGDHETLLDRTVQLHPQMSFDDMSDVGDDLCIALGKHPLHYYYRRKVVDHCFLSIPTTFREFYDLLGYILIVKLL